MVTWDKYRREDNTIDLYQAWLGEHADLEPFNSREIRFLKGHAFYVEEMQRINSRQVAALYLATTTQVLLRMRDHDDAT